jgi:hypothetical protein
MFGDMIPSYKILYLFGDEIPSYKTMCLQEGSFFPTLCDDRQVFGDEIPSYKTMYL